MTAIIKHPGSNTLETATATINHTLRSLENLDPQLGDTGEIRGTIERIRAWSTGAEYDALRRTIEQAATPATEREVCEHLFVLVHAFPNAANRDLTGYGKLLAKYVLEKHPTRYGIAKSVEKLIQTCGFVPTISETLNALSDAEARVRQAEQWMRELPTEIINRTARLLERVARRESEQEDERRRQRAGRETWR